MDPYHSGRSDESLERSCERSHPDWISSTGAVGGVELLQAWFAGKAYETHRHDTYAIGLTDCGVQVFDYRGTARTSLPGQVTVLYPDEQHNGRAGNENGFGYRIVYVEPAQVSEALQVVCGRPYPLPFVRDAVSTNPRLVHAIHGAFQLPLESLAYDSLMLDLAAGLLDGERQTGQPAASHNVAVRAVELAQQFLDAERTRVVHSVELEQITSLSRFELARQFKLMYGTSPYRYLLMRRLEHARRWIHQQRPLVTVALDAGFADQAHFTRVFKAAFGITPARYRSLWSGTEPQRHRGGSR